MFEIGWTELLVIAVVAIIVVGPKDLPRMLRTIGRYAGKFKRMAGEFRTQFDDALRESEFDDLRSSMRDMADMKPLDDIKRDVGRGLDPLRKTADGVKQGVEGPAAQPGSQRAAAKPARAKPQSDGPDAQPGEKPEGGEAAKPGGAKAPASAKAGD